MQAKALFTRAHDLPADGEYVDVYVLAVRRSVPTTYRAAQFLELSSERAQLTTELRQARAAASRMIQRLLVHPLDKPCPAVF